MTTNYKAEAVELEAILDRETYNHFTPREMAMLQDLAKIGAYVLTASALDYNGNAEASMDQEISHAAHNQGWLNPHNSDNLPYYLALAKVLKIDPSDYGVEPDQLAFHEPARTAPERAALKRGLIEAYREYVAAHDVADRLYALQGFADKLADYSGVEVVAP